MGEKNRKFKNKGINVLVIYCLSLYIHNVYKSFYDFMTYMCMLLKLFPRKITRLCRNRNQNVIPIFDSEDGKSYECVVHATNRNKDEKYIGQGW